MARQASDTSILGQLCRVMIHEVDWFANRGELIASHWIWMTTRDPRSVIDERFEEVILPMGRNGTFWAIGHETGFRMCGLNGSWNLSTTLSIRHSILAVCSSTDRFLFRIRHLQVLRLEQRISCLWIPVALLSGFERTALASVYILGRRVILLLEWKTYDFLRMPIIEIYWASFHDFG